MSAGTLLLESKVYKILIEPELIYADNLNSILVLSGQQLSVETKVSCILMNNCSFKGKMRFPSLF